MYLFPKTIIQNLDRQRRSFFWQGGGTKRKYHLIRWSTITLSKKDGGLGIKDIAKMDISLLCKWWWRLEHESGIWQEIIQAKYLHGKPIGVVHHRLNDSSIWTDLLKVKQFYLKGRTIHTKNGKNTLFWLDSWLDNKPLSVVHSVLFDLCSNQEVTVFEFLRLEGQLSFNRWLPPFLFDQWWLNLVNTVFSYHFANSPDIVSWKWNS